MADIEDDRATYAGKADWDEYCTAQLKALDGLIRGSGYTEQEIRSAKKLADAGCVSKGRSCGFHAALEVPEGVHIPTVEAIFGARALRLRRIYRRADTRCIYHSGFPAP
jgi:hypothetical protein